MSTSPSGPIFVVGRSRSGTKWLSNIVLRHPAVSGVQDQSHGGILETSVFSTMRESFGDLAADENRAAFLSCFLGTDTFVFSGLTKEEFLGAVGACRGYGCFFGSFMRQVVSVQGGQTWLQKIAPEVLPFVASCYGGASYLMIRRELLPTVASAVALGDRLGIPVSLPREVANFCHARKITKRYQTRLRTFAIRFEDLVREREERTRQVMGFLGLSFDPCVLEDAFARNSSFPDEDLRRDAMVRVRRPVFVLRLLFAGMPFQVLDSVAKFLRMPEKGPRFQKGTFKVMIESYFGKKR